MPPLSALLLYQLSLHHNLSSSLLRPPPSDVFAFIFWFILLQFSVLLLSLSSNHLTGIRPSPPLQKSMLYHHLQHCRADLPLDAIRAFEKKEGILILKLGIDDLDQLLLMLCKKKLVKLAQGFFDGVKLNFTPTPKSYSILMRGCGDMGSSSEVPKLFDEILQRGCSID